MVKGWLGVCFEDTAERTFLMDWILDIKAARGQE